MSQVSEGVGQMSTGCGIINRSGTRYTMPAISTRRRSTKTRANGSRTPLRAAEFFAGIGLVRLALERQGWQVVFANDIDPDKAEMYRHNWPKDDHLVVGDIHKLDPDTIPTCHLFTASFPCNDLSLAGKWEGLNGKSSSAFWGFVDILREMGDRKPPMVLLENVVGFLHSQDGRDFEQALLAFNSLGYSVDAFILNAVQWRPQSRPRLFVVAGQSDTANRSTEAIANEVRSARLAAFINSHQNVLWNLRSLPPLPKRKVELEEVLDDLPASDPHWWTKERATYFKSQMSAINEKRARELIEGRQFGYATAFRRMRNKKPMAELRVDGIAGCLRTPRGGSARQIVFKAGKGGFQVRLLTARECARLQGVPDSYPIRVGLNRSLFGFGDAVCVPVIEWIAKHYLIPWTHELIAAKKTRLRVRL